MMLRRSERYWTPSSSRSSPQDSFVSDKGGVEGFEHTDRRLAFPPDAPSGRAHRCTKAGASFGVSSTIEKRRKRSRGSEKRASVNY
jgi:hypothetical protein